MKKARVLFYAQESIGFWGWYSFGYWASSCIYPITADVWWFNQFGFCGLFGLAIACALMLDRQARIRHAALDWLSLAAALIALIVLSHAPFTRAELVPLLIGGTALGFFSSWSLVRWGSHYVSLDAKENIILLLFGILGASLVKLLSFLLPSLVLLLFGAILIAMTLLLRSHTRNEDFFSTFEQSGAPTSSAPPVMHAIHNRYTLQTIASLWQTILSIALFFVLWSFLNLVFTSNLGHITVNGSLSIVLVVSTQVIDIGFSLFMLWWVLKKKRSIDWTLFWQIGYFFLAIGLLTMSLFGPSRAVQVFLSASAELVFMFLVYFLVHLGRRSIYKPPVVIALGYATISLIDWAVRAAVSYTHVSLDSMTYVPVFLFTILVVIVFLLPARSPGMHLLTAELQVHTNRVGASDDQKIRNLGKERGLSTRELDVLVLLCHGRSAPYIAETLYLSENTVKTYRKRIYQKLGIHDKQEMLDMMEQREDPAETEANPSK